MGESEATAALKSTRDLGFQSSPPRSPDSLVAIVEHLHLDQANGGTEALEAKVGVNGDSKKEVGVVNGGIDGDEKRSEWGGDECEGLKGFGDGECGEKVEEGLDEVRGASGGEGSEVVKVVSADWGAEDAERTAWASAEDEREEKEEVVYPQRPGRLDCTYYLKNGTCAFGSNCKFNHPPRTLTSDQGNTWDLSAVTATAQEYGAEAFAGKGGKIECKYHLMPGGCKYGKFCKYEHVGEKIEAQPMRLNFLGLPIRPELKDCPYYMRTGACKYSVNCCFNHPDPTATARQNSFSGHLDGGSLPQNSSMAHISSSVTDHQHTPVASPYMSISSKGTPNSAIPVSNNFPYIPRMPFPPRGANLTSIPNEHQAPTSMHSPPIAKTELTPYPPSDGTTTISDCASSQQMQLDFPERPGQTECPFFMKTGNCKFRSQCKFHHPRSRLSKASMCSNSPHGLPLRPDQPICSSYSRFGICKYGPACKFDHPVDFNSSPTGVARSYREIVNARAFQMEG